jgi:uncharacterized protein
METVSIDVAGQRVDGTLFQQASDKPSPAFMFLHGWTSRKDRHLERAEALASLGMTTLAISFRGHGNSEGDFNQLSRFDHTQDAVAAYDFLAALPGVDSRRIGAFGSSYGGYTSLLLTGMRDVRYLALWDPALYPDQGYSTPTTQLIEQDPNVFRQSGLTYKNNMALAGMATFSGELLLMRSDQTDVVPLTTYCNYLKVAPGPKTMSVLINGSDHTLSDPKCDREMKDVLTTWAKCSISF